jgi:hypothetical protein
MARPIELSLTILFVLASGIGGVVDFIRARLARRQIEAA